jgi:hypothetical protein
MGFSPLLSGVLPPVKPKTLMFPKNMRGKVKYWQNIAGKKKEGDDMITDKQKQIIKGMRRAGFPYSAIAESTGLPLNTVKSFCRRENVSVSVDSALCEYCGKPLEQRLGAKKRRFCNNKCRWNWWNRNREWANHKKNRRQICQRCGVEFMSIGNKKRKYCSRDCYIKSRYGEGLP